MSDPALHVRLEADLTRTYQQRAYDFVKAQIMGLHLRPGQYITDSQVADELSISRTPAREALRRLQQEHLVVKEARRGWKVLSLSLQDIENIFEIKVILEGVIARRAAGCQDAGLRAALKVAMEQMNRAAAAGDYQRWRQADLELHRIVFAMCPNKRAGRIIANLNDQWYRVRVGFVALEGRIERSNCEHRAMVDSILAGDGDEAERQMRTHLSNVQEELMHVLDVVMPFVHEGL